MGGTFRGEYMFMTAWDNVKDRYVKAASILRLEDEIISELLGFKQRLSFDMMAQVNGKMESLKVVRVRHRAPLKKMAYKGGLRFLKGTTLSSMESHAAEMSVKCWIHELPYGGAKGGVDLDPRQCSPKELEAISKKLVDELDERVAIGPALDVPAPDVGTNATIMFWMAEHYSFKHPREFFTHGVVTGKPVVSGNESINRYLGGIHGRKEATGFGVMRTLSAFRNKLFSFGETPTMIIQGFGNVGSHTAKFAEQEGFRIIGVSDEFGAIHNSMGISVADLEAYCSASKPRSVVGYPRAEAVDKEELLEMPCDVLVPAALEEVITKDNAAAIRAKVILEGANGPTTPEADEILEDRRIVVVPDILANSCGVTVSYFEWGRNTDQSDPRIPMENDAGKVLMAAGTMMDEASAAVLRRVEKYKIAPRLAAYVFALEKAELLRVRRMPEYAMKLFG